MSTFEEASKTFAASVEAEQEKRREERAKKLEVAWATLAGTVNNAGTAKSNLYAARMNGESDVFMFAQEFRTAEAQAVEALHAVINLISEEGGL